ncbi:MAG: SGNH/GDSL hydrolase family protein [Micrococcales bacterium]|nr:SGNH/GDSL hydrolase family protein [Micrococcales bacterium]
MRSVVALGDSVTQGQGCECDAFPQLIATALSDRSGHSVAAVNDGMSGQTARDLADVLDPVSGDDDVRADIRHADVVIVTTGANDVAATEPDPAAQSKQQLQQGPAAGAVDAATQRAVVVAVQDLSRAITQVKALAPSARVLVTNYWNLFPDGAQAAPDETQRAWTDAVTRDFNAELARAAGAAGVQIVDLYDPFKAGGQIDPGPLLLDDGDHPDAQGHQVIADAVLRALGF